MKKINSKIIAQLAGVSRSTVSRVINNYPDISPETKEKVLKVIEENGYYPNLSAQKLAGKKSGIIGLLVYTGKSSTNEKNYKKISESLYYSELISKIIDAAENLGYLVLVSYINKKGTTWEKIFANGIIDGALVISGGKKFKEIENLINSKNKIVLLDYEKNIANSTVSVINPNHFEGGYKATQYLIENGHENILHLTGEIRRKTSIKRARGYLKCLKDNNIEKQKIISGKFTQESSYKIIDEYIKKNKAFDYTAIFAGNDYIALGAMRALAKHGIDVPKKVSIIGYDNMELCEYTTPKITSINHLDDFIAEKALVKLMNILKGEQGVIENTEIRVIERGSVLNLKAK